MIEVRVRAARPSDRAALLRGIVDQQEFERTLHDTRRPGAEVAEPYLQLLEDRTFKRRGAMFLAEDGSGAFVGFVAGWIQEDDVLAETADSSRYGYVADVYVAPERRGQGVAGQLLAAIERHLRDQGVARLRIGSLASNDRAIRAYLKHGFQPYEVVLEKKLSPPP